MEGRLPTYFLSHGGGPWPYMQEHNGGRYDKLAAALADVARQVGAPPKAVLVVSAHWEGRAFLVSGAAQPGMIYDYGGFPEHTYHIVYGAPGAPALAERVAALLGAAGLAAQVDPVRGFDHASYSMLYPIYPQAEVPVVQLSLRSDLDPLAHIEAGRALAALRDEGVLILGSGLSYHNLRAFGAGGRDASHAFDAWLQRVLDGPVGVARSAALLAWAEAPAARAAHPREEHLLPLMVAVGAAEHEAGCCVYHEDDFMGALAVSSFRFGA
ncbi:MAG: class III extradiol ring-cleavage dioxygenase [Pseudomonadota bacterium]